jgi:hypothetical protein
MLKEEDAITAKPQITLAQRHAFMRMTIEERRRVLAEQSKELMAHYREPMATREREEWQGGEVVEF